MARRKELAAAVCGGVGVVAIVFYLAACLRSDVTITPTQYLLIQPVIALPLYAAGRFYASAHPEIKTAIMKRTFWALFLLYLFLILFLTLFDPAFGRGGFTGGIWNVDDPQKIRDSVNLVPFKTIELFYKGYQKGVVSLRTLGINLAGNLLAFMPFALFFPLLTKHLRRFFPFLGGMIAVVAAVEGSQLLFMTGNCDVDDLILNVGGAVILYGILHVPPIRKAVTALTCLPYGGKYK